MTRPLLIDVVSDVVCPWCFLGKRRLDRALAALPEIAATVRWRPFQLDPTIPAGGIDRRAYMERKFGSLDAVRPAHERLEAMGRELGIAYRFDAISRSPNTLDAHRLIRWADAEGCQGAVVEGLFAAYFTEARDIGDHAVLADIAAAAGMDREAVLARLAGEEDRAAVEEEIGTAQRIGVTGVPTYILDQRYGVVGAQSVETLAEAIRKVASAKAEAAE